MQMVGDIPAGRRVQSFLDHDHAFGKGPLDPAMRMLKGF
jgi:hypothetical protein